MGEKKCEENGAIRLNENIREEDEAIWLDEKIVIKGGD